MIAWHSLEVGTHRLACPACNKSKRDTALSVTIEAIGRGVAFCHRCQYTEVWRDTHATMRAGTRQKAPQAPVRHEVLSTYGRELWNACRPISGVATDYLLARSCVVPPDDGDLKWHPALRHPSGFVGPALVALLTDAIDCTPRSLHRTWIKPNGEKANVEPARMLLGGHRKSGAVVRLWPDEAVTLGLGIAEGVETALSLAHAFTPVWSAIDAGNLADFPVLEGIDSITIAADHDAAGLKAARTCARRWRDAGKSARVVLPDQFGADLNDLAQGVAA